MDVKKCNICDIFFFGDECFVCKGKYKDKMNTFSNEDFPEIFKDIFGGSFDGNDDQHKDTI